MTHPLVAAPAPGDAGCWARPCSSADRLRDSNCRHRPRPGHLTCGKHRVMEPQARRLQAKLASG